METRVSGVFDAPDAAEETREREGRNTDTPPSHFACSNEFERRRAEWLR